MSARHATLPSELLERYEPYETLGEGVTSVVFRAWQRSLDRPVVVKLLKLRNLDVAVFRARFELEARLLARLDHPHVLQILDYGMVPGAAYMAYPDDRGTSLRQVLATRRRLPHTEVRRLVDEVLAGLDHVHRQGVVHRDLKPANLLQREDGSWAILDLGLARALNDDEGLTATGILLGTPLYMAPQQIRGEAPAPADDIYSLGILAYEALVGKNPCEGDTVREILDLHLQGAIPSLASCAPDVPPDLAAALEGLMAPTREARLRGAKAWRVAPPAPEAKPDPPRPGLLEATPVGPAAPSPPRGVGPATALAALLALGLPWMLWRPWGPGATPVLVRPPTAAQDPTPRPAGPAALPAGLLDRLRREFETMVDGLPRDPARWGEALEALPATRDFVAWVQGGGEPADLDPTTHEALRGIDQGYRDMGRTRPLEAMLEARPWRAPVSLSSDPQADLRIPPALEGRAQRGWIATALAEYQEAMRGYEDRRREIQGLFDGTPLGARVPPRLAALLQVRSVVIRHVRRTNLSEFARTLWTSDVETRRELCEWLREPSAALIRMLYAIARVDSPPARDLLIPQAHVWVGQLEGLTHAAAFLVPASTLVACQPRHPSQHLLLALVAVHGLKPLLGAGLAIQDRAASVERHLADGLRAHAGGAPETSTMQLVAEVLLDLVEVTGPADGPLPFLRRHHALLAALPGEARARLRETVLARLDSQARKQSARGTPVSYRDEVARLLATPP